LVNPKITAMKNFYLFLLAIFCSMASQATVAPITGTNTVCSGASTILSDATPGGTWSCASVFAVVDAATGVVTGTAAGTATITYTLGAGTATAVVTVNAALPAISAYGSHCLGTTSSLSAGAAGGIWTSSDISVGTISSAGGSTYFTALAVGTTTVSYALSAGCFVSTVVTTNPVPAAITGATGICAGSTTTLANAVSGGTWSTSFPSLATIDYLSGVVTGLAAGSTSVFYKLPGGCIASSSIYVAGVTTAITGNTIFCPGTSAPLSYAAAGGAWTSDNISIASVDATSGSVSAVAPGTATISYTLSGCVPATKIVTVSSTIPGITGASWLCHGSGAYQANTMSGGTWSSSNTSIVMIGTGNGYASAGASAGTATISYTVGSCGAVTKMVSVETTVPYPGGASYICNTGTATVTNTLSGGSWSSSNTATATIGAVTGVVTAVASGYTMITYTMPSGCYNSITFYVYPAPAILPGCDNMGIGDVMTFPTPQYSMWNSSNTAVATVDAAGTVHGVTAGTATITNSSPFVGCIEGYKTISVTPTALLLQMTGNNILCTGETLTLSNASGGGTWTSGDASIATINTSGLVTAMAGGYALITYTNAASTASCTRMMYVNSALAPLAGPTTICAGNVITLSEPVNPYYQWGVTNTTYFYDPGCAWAGPCPIPIDGTFPPSPVFTSSDESIALPAGLVSGSINGIAAGIATITYTPSTHCFVTSTITVNPLTVAPITGNLSLCLGGNTTLSDATTGGTWSSSNPYIVTVDPATGIVTAVSAGTAKITYTNGSACGSIVVIVAVNPNPQPITGNPGTICVGANVTLGESLSGGTWSSSNLSAVTVSTSGVLTGVAAGSATITYMAGACGAYVVTTVNVSTTYPIVGSRNVCSGTTSYLSAAGAGTWTSSNTAVATVGSAIGTLTAIAAGTTAITFTSAVCGITSVIATVYPASPITGPSAICVGSSATMSSPDAGGTWTLTGSAGSIDASGTLVGIVNGSTVISYSQPTGCIVTKNVSIQTMISYGVNGGGTFCSGGTGVPVSMASMASGTSYQLFRSGTAIGAPLTTTSGTYSFGLQNMPGTYYVIGSNGTCSQVMSNTVTVAVTPAVGTIAGANILCAGTYVSGAFSNTTAGGTWSSNNPSIASVNITNGDGAGNSVGTATISYNTSCGIATKAVTVNTNPPAITGASSICQGSTATLTIGDAGGTWSSSLPIVGTVDPSTGVVTGIMGGATAISYRAANGCSVFKAVTVVSKPVISGFAYVAVGSTSALSAPGTGTWSSSNTAVGTISPTGVVTGISLGSTVVSYFSSSGCTGLYTMNVTPACSGAPSAGTATTSVSAPVCPLTPIIIGLTGNTVGYDISYQWQSSANGTTWANISGVTTPSFTDYPGTDKYYRCLVSCTSSGFSTYSAAVHVSVIYSIASHGIVAVPDTVCSNAHFYISSCGSTTSLNVTTWFGDGTSANMPLSYYSGTTAANVYHNYTLPGTYSVKQVIYLGTVPQDSVTFSYEHFYCHTLPIKFYQDFNSNCAFDAGDNYNMLLVTVEVDSNDIPIDTIAVTSGMYRKTTGPSGTVYAFRVLSVSGARIVACPSGGVIYDTISSSVYTYAAKYFGLQCITSSDFDLAESVTMAATTGVATGHIYISNAYCTAVSPVVTMHMSPKYHYGSATPAPTSVVGNTITWDLPTVSTGGISTRHIAISMLPSYGLMPGDTVLSDYQVIPLTGDVNTVNNYVTLINTITGSYDPNNMSVSPEGSILPCQQLMYTINFENIGTDTAHNVSVLDTLPAYVDAASLNIATSSSTMNVTVMNDGVHNIARFDFPGIDLPDISSPAYNHGMLVFTINANNPLADGINITNSAGIYFDINPAIMTNTVMSTIGIGNITGIDSVCTGAAIVLTDTTAGGAWSSSTAAATVSGGTVTGVSGASVIISYSVSNSCVTRIATKAIIVNAAPVAGSITGSSAVCIGASITESHATTGGTWASSDPGVAPIDASGNISGSTVGTSSISYTMTNSCGTATATKVVTVNPLPDAGTISGAAAVCVGTTTALTTTVASGTWAASNGNATITGNTVTGVTAGSVTLTYTFTNSCGVSIVTYGMTVNPLPNAGSISGASSVCESATITLTPTISGGAWSTSNGNATAFGGSVSGIAAGAVNISYAVTTTCGTAVIAHVMTVNPLPAAGTISGSNTVCESATITLTDASPGGIWSADNGNATVSAGNVSGVTAGTVAISYTVTNVCGTDNTSVVITVNPLPAPDVISGSATVCELATTTLTTVVSGGVWSISNGNATISAGAVTGLTAGIDTVYYSLANTCGTTTASFEMTVDPLPHAGTISGTNVVCQAAAITLTDASAGGMWSTSNSNATISGGVVTGAAAGTVTISYSLTNDCGTDVTTKDVTVNPLPDPGTITGPTYVCPGSVITLTALVTGGTWHSSNSNASISAVGVVTGVTAGVSVISYAFTNTCGTAAAIAVVIINPLPDAGTITGAATVCASATTTLTNSVTGGAWSASNGHANVGSTGIVTGSTAGIDTIKYTYTNSCGTATTTHIMTVNPLPATSTIAGSSTACVAGTTVLTSSVTGGAWSATNANATIVSGTVAGVVTGIDTIRYTITNSCGAATATHIMTVSPAPMAGTITGVAAVCETAAITLTDAAAGGTWSASNSNATVAAGVVTGIAAGTVTISYTVTNSCGVAGVSMDVTINPMPAPGVISGPGTVCSGSSITLADTASGGTWSVSNTHITIAGGVVTSISPGTVGVSYTVVNGCGTNAASIILTVIPLPNAGTIAGEPTVCLADTTLLSDVSPGGIWSHSNSNVIVVAGLVTGLSVGTADISYTVTNACGSAATSITMLVKICPLEIVTSNAGTELQIFPNPATEELTIVAAAGAFSDVSVTNSIGEVVVRQAINASRLVVAINKLVPGMYYVTLRGTNGNVVRKFVKL
jgi:uncharacterized protein YjdB